MTKALQAYQILGLKYPEKNSFFADQIKEIKRLQKLKDRPNEYIFNIYRPYYCCLLPLCWLLWFKILRVEDFLLLWWRWITTSRWGSKNLRLLDRSTWILASLLLDFNFNFKR